MKIVVILILASSFFVKTLKASILPENNHQIPPSMNQTGLSFEEYNNAIDRVEAIYRRDIEAYGIKFTVNRLWDDPKVNAGTFRNNNEWVVNLYGGYARHPLVTVDSYLMVFCHELGHHLGGAPQKIFSSTNLPGWASTEGQSDYFASLKCLRRVFEKEDNIQIVEQINVPAMVNEKCNRAFSLKNDVAICIRTAMAGLVTASISSTIGKNKGPRFEMQDSQIVEQTYEGHPNSQCRLDTYFQGAICEVPYVLMVSDKDESQGVCHKANGHFEGLRPGCWFKPTLISK